MHPDPFLTLSDAEITSGVDSFFSRHWQRSVIRGGFEDIDVSGNSTGSFVSVPAAATPSRNSAQDDCVKALLFRPKKICENLRDLWTGFTAANAHYCRPRRDNWTIDARESALRANG